MNWAVDTETRGTRIAGIVLWIVILCFVISEVLDSMQQWKVGQELTVEVPDKI